MAPTKIFVVLSALLFLSSSETSLGSTSTLSETSLGRDADELTTTTTPAWAAEMIMQQEAAEARADAVVSKDGSGNFTTIGAAIDSAPENSSSRYIIHVRGGVYDEIVRIPWNKRNLTLVGDGAGVTVITGSRSVDDKYSMPETATVGKNR